MLSTKQTWVECHHLFFQKVLIALSETWHLGVTLLTARVINFNQRGGEWMINY